MKRLVLVVFALGCFSGCASRRTLHPDFGVAYQKAFAAQVVPNNPQIVSKPIVGRDPEEALFVWMNYGSLNLLKGLKVKEDVSSLEALKIEEEGK